MRLAAFATCAALLAGCISQEAVPYVPDRELAASIPPEMALAELRRVLGLATVYGAPTPGYKVLLGEDDPFEPLRKIEIEASHMTLADREALRRYRYADLAPKAMKITNGMWPDRIYVRLTPGDIGGFTRTTLHDNDIIAFDAARTDEVATLFDALASLGATPRSLSAPPVARWRDELVVVGIVVVWGVNFSIAKDALARVDRSTFNAARFTLSMLLLLALWRREVRRGTVPAIGRDGWWQLVGLGLLGNIVYQVLFIEGLDRTTSGNCALLIASSPLWTALASRAMGVERLGWRGLAGMALTIAGVGWLSADGLGRGRWVGDLLTLGAAICWGTYTALCRPVLRRASPLAISAVGVTLACPVLWGVAAPTLDLAPLATPRVIFAVAFSGLLSVGIAYWLWARAVERLGASHTAVYVNAVPVVAVACGVVALGERLSAAQVGGGVLVLVGLTVVRSGRS